MSYVAFGGEGFRGAKSCYDAKKTCEAEGKPLLDCSAPGPFPDPLTGNAVLFRCGAASGGWSDVPKIACEASGGEWTGTECKHPSVTPPSQPPPEPVSPPEPQTPQPQTPPVQPPATPGAAPVETQDMPVMYIVGAAAALGFVAFIIGRAS